MAWKVNFFQTARGDCPVKEFIGEQNPTVRSKIALSILLLKNQGPFLKPPYIKKLKDKLYEIRISGTTQIRIFYTSHHSEY